MLASLSKRGDEGHALLSSNAMLQMAGRAGRRGIDEQGNTVVVQTPFEGAEDCCKLLFAGSDPLVSQFTATYGMALNLLAVSIHEQNILQQNFFYFNFVVLVIQAVVASLWGIVSVLTQGLLTLIL